MFSEKDKWLDNEQEIEEFNFEDYNEEEKHKKIDFNGYIVENDINLNKLKMDISAALYIAGDDGIDINVIKKITNQPIWFVKKLIQMMINEYHNDDKFGLNIEIYQRIFKFVTKPQCYDALSNVIDVKFKNPLNQKLMETLAIVAYNQPCRRAVIEKIRGKDPKASLDRLVDLGLIIAKKSDFVGKPFVYTVTSKFYDLFNLKSLASLPKIETKLLNELPTNDTEIED